MSKKAEKRSKHQKESKRQRLLIFIALGALLLIAAGVLLTQKAEKDPIGEIILPTQPPRPLASGNAMGDPNAPVKVEEFSDFQCPGCKQFSDILEPEIVDTYVATNKVYFIFTPFSFLGQESIAAAEAAYCASDQGKFWEYKDILYANWNGENQGAFNNRRLLAFAEKLGLDLNQFRTCVENKTHSQKVTDDRLYGTNKGVNSTPSFLVNGKKVSLGQLTQTIEEALAAAQ